MGLIDTLGAGRVAVDTAIFIYFIEEHPKYLSLIDPLFQQVDAGNCQIVTSGITLLEVLVVPYRAGNFPLAARYEVLLSKTRGVTMVDVDRAQLRTAAQIRAVHRVKAPDALQLAAAYSQGCGVFLTNERELPALPGIRIVQLNDLH